MVEKKTSQGQKKPPKITVNEKWCKKCGICVSLCPRGVFVSDEFGLPIVKYPEKCIRCMLCVVRCPDFAMDVEDVEEEDKET